MNESLLATSEPPVTVSPSAAPFAFTTEPSTKRKYFLYDMISQVATNCSVEKNTAKQYIIAHCRTDFSERVIGASFDIPDGEHTARMASLYYLPYCMEEPLSQLSLDMPLGRGIVNHCLCLFKDMLDPDQERPSQMQISQQLGRPEGSSEGRQRPTVQSTEHLFNEQRCRQLHTAWLVCLTRTKSALDDLSPGDSTRSTVGRERCEDAKKWLSLKGLIPEWVITRESGGVTSEPQRSRPLRPLRPAPVRARPSDFVEVEATNAGFRLRPDGDSYQQ